MKHALHATVLRAALLLLLLSLLLSSLPACSEQESYVSLGIPYSQLKAVARIPWDLAIHDGYLYVGAGDYGRNISPQTAKRASLADFVWQDCGKIDDEQINRFLLLGDELVIPGTDPTGSWETGSYYRLDGDSFTSVNTIPRGVHTFDMIEYHNMLFAALGVDDERFPLVYSRDGGATFETVQLLKDQQAVPTDSGVQNRIYDFFLLGEDLYLLYYHNLYRYAEENGVPYFDYVASWSHTYQVAEENYVPILSKTQFKDKIFFTTQTLYVCTEEDGTLGTPSPVTLPQGECITDLFVYNDTLYLLGFEKNTFSYTVSVQASQDGESFETLFSFSHKLPAMSFVYDGEAFYFGMGKLNASDKSNGEILQYPFAEPKQPTEAAVD